MPCGSNTEYLGAGAGKSVRTFRQVDPRNMAVIATYRGSNPSAAAHKAASRGHQSIVLVAQNPRVGYKQPKVYAYEGARVPLAPHQQTAHTQRFGIQHKTVVKRLSTAAPTESCAGADIASCHNSGPNCKWQDMGQTCSNLYDI